MLAHGCGAADARLTASARFGLQVAGRDAGTGAPTKHRNSRKKRAPATERPQSPKNDANAVAVVFTRFYGQRLHRLLGSEPLLIGDLILAEVLQGFRRDAHYCQAKALLDTLELRLLGGKDVAVTAADNFRRLRRAGITPRKTIDMIIGTYCIIHGLELLHADRDFDVLRQKLGLRVVTP